MDGDAGQGDYLKVYPLEKREAGWFIGLKDSWLKKFFLVLLCCTLFSHAYPQALLDWPQRPIHAKSGSELTELWMHVDQSEREQQIKKELLNGNFPDWNMLIPVDDCTKDKMRLILTESEANANPLRRSQSAALPVPALPTKGLFVYSSGLFPGSRGRLRKLPDQRHATLPDTDFS